MNKVINIRNKRAIDKINEFKLKKYENCDVRFENVYLKKLNEVLDRNLFSKNDLFINSVSLWELMQPIGSCGTHNYHNLLPNDILDALLKIDAPYCILKTKNNRIIIVPDFISSFEERLMIVLEIGAELINRQNANINKIVTMYPKSGLDEIILKMKEDEILFKK